MSSRALRLKYNKKSAKKIADVVKTRELQSDIYKIFSVCDFNEFGVLVNDQGHHVVAEIFARQYYHRVASGYKAEQVYDDLYDLGYNALSQALDDYSEKYESLTQGRIRLSPHKVFDRENKFVRQFNKSLEFSAFNLAYVVEGFLHPPAEKVMPQTPGINM